MKTTLLLFFLCAANAAVHAQVTNQRLFDTIPFLPGHYRNRVEEFRKEPVVRGGVIFLGNSITEDGPWQELAGNMDIVNRGIGGGIKDIARDIPAAVIADNVKRIISKLRTGSPGDRDLSAKYFARESNRGRLSAALRQGGSCHQHECDAEGSFAANKLPLHQPLPAFYRCAAAACP